MCMFGFEGIDIGHVAGGLRSCGLDFGGLGFVFGDGVS